MVAGNNSVTGNELGHDSTSGLDTKSEGVDVNEDDITKGLITGKDTTLDSGTIGHSLIRVNALRRFLVEVLLKELLNLGDTSGTADKDNLTSKC